MARRAAARFKLGHPPLLERRRLLAGLLDLQPHGLPPLEAEQVGYPGELVRPAVNLDDVPAVRFRHAGDRGDDGGLARHPSLVVWTAEQRKGSVADVSSGVFFKVFPDRFA